MCGPAVLGQVDAGIEKGGLQKYSKYEKGRNERLIREQYGTSSKQYQAYMGIYNASLQKYGANAQQATSAPTPKATPQWVGPPQKTLGNTGSARSVVIKR